MVSVCGDEAVVEAELVGGHLGCPSCEGVLGPWGHARERVLRCRSGDWRLRPRGARWRGCLGTHVLLPDLALLRRQDEVAVIGEAIEAISAIVVLKQDVEPEALIEFAKQRLAPYKVPKSVHVVDELPKNASGKLLKRDLRRAFGGSESAVAAPPIQTST